MLLVTPIQTCGATECVLDGGDVYHNDLNQPRKRYMCLGSQAPVGELLGLQAYRRAISRSDGPSSRVGWSEDGETLRWDGAELSMKAFRQYPPMFATQPHLDLVDDAKGRRSMDATTSSAYLHHLPQNRVERRKCVVPLSTDEGHHVCRRISKAITADTRPTGQYEAIVPVVFPTVEPT